MTARAEARTALLTTPTADLYGSSRMMLETINALREGDWRVVVAIPNSGPLVDEMVARGAEVHVMPSAVLRKTVLTPRGSLLFLLAMVRFFPEAVRLLRKVRPDFVYANTIIEPLWLLVARCSRRPVFCHAHEGEASASRLVRKALAWPLQFAHRLILNSEFTAGVLHDAVPRLARRSVVIYNGVPGPPRGAATCRESIDGDVRLVYIGRLSPRKGVFDAVEAVGILNERGTPAVLDMVGSVFPGYEWVEEELIERCERMGLSGRVRLRGFDSDVWHHLESADILLVPSQIDESFGNVAIEGALAARPVVVTTVGGLGEAVRGLESSVAVPPGSPAAMADAIEEIIGKWPLVRQQAFSDSQRAASQFDPSKYRRAIRTEVESVVR